MHNLQARLIARAASQKLVSDPFATLINLQITNSLYLVRQNKILEEKEMFPKDCFLINATISAVWLMAKPLPTSVSKVLDMLLCALKYDILRGAILDC